MSVETAQILGPEGLLEQKHPGFRSREAQLEMALCVEEAIASGTHAVLEGGTGLGKTYAYLVPLLLSGKSALISTGTKNLQDQLFRKDLPELCAALGAHPEVRVLKGRANYLCKLRFERLRATPGLVEEDAAEWRAVEMFARETKDGNLDDLDAVKDTPALRTSLASTTESCPARECEHYDACHFYEARRAAKEAQVVVVNHHLYLSDFSLREEERGEILPDPEMIVFDEAHSLPEAAVSCFGHSVSTLAMMRQLSGLMREVGLALPNAVDARREIEAVSSLHKGLLSGADGGRGGPSAREAVPYDAIGADAERRGMVESFSDSILRVAKRVASLEGLPLDLKSISSALSDTARHLREWVGSPGKGGASGGGQGRPAAGVARWAVVGERGISFNDAPVDVSAKLGKHFSERDGACVFTSATLSVGDSLEPFCASLGLEGPLARAWASPFPYEECSLLLVPDDMPVPQGGSHQEHARRVVEVVGDLAVENGGRAFALFTSLSAMRRAAKMLRKRLRSSGIAVLVQQEEGGAALLERFRRMERCILVGSHSFASGIDIKGAGLSLVAFDKIPFIPPNDPLFRAREELCEERGEAPFQTLQIPHAALSLKQAAGRLIRDESDRGVFVLCDPRIMRPGYGKTLIRSLPPMRLTRDVEDAKQMLRSIR